MIDNIGELVTNAPKLGAGPLGIVEKASVVIDGDTVVSVGPPGAVADERLDAGGRCVIPGFVDSHTHLVFQGDRAEAFTRRMAGEHYDGGGIRVTTEATRAAGREALRASLAGRLEEVHRAGTTTVEIKSGYGLSVESETATTSIAAEVTQESTFMGAHVVPTEYLGRTDEYVDLVCGPMLEAVRPHVRWIDAFCETGAFDADQSRAVLEAGRAAGLGLRLHANQLDYGPGVRLGVEMGCASVDHCTYLSDYDIEALAASETVATFLPAADFSTRQPYPDARRAVDAGVTVAIASNCNPGSSSTPDTSPPNTFPQMSSSATWAAGADPAAQSPTRLVSGTIVNMPIRSGSATRRSRWFSRAPRPRRRHSRAVKKPLIRKNTGIRKP